MFYTALVSRGQSKADQLADAIEMKTKPASVYVIGLSDKEAFAAALTDGLVQIDDDMDAAQALKCEWVQAFGTEDGPGSLPLLISGAKNLAAEINAAGGHMEYSAKLARFAGRR